MKDFRGPLPLHDADFAAIRANVMANVEKKRRHYAFEWGLAFAAIALAILSFVAARQPAVAPSSIATHHARALAPERAVSIAAVQPHRVRIAHHRRSNRRPAPPTVARMEIQTADSDVRIIWITNQESTK
jgi:hypothetical protein